MSLIAWVALCAACLCLGFLWTLGELAGRAAYRWLAGKARAVRDARAIAAACRMYGQVTAPPRHVRMPDGKIQRVRP